MRLFLPATGLLLPLRLQAIGASPIWLGLCGSALSLGVLARVLGLADRCMARLGRLRARFAAIAVYGLMSAGFLVSGLALLLVPDLRPFLAASTKEASGWYQRRYPQAFKRASPPDPPASPPPPR